MRKSGRLPVMNKAKKASPSSNEVFRHKRGASLQRNKGFDNALYRYVLPDAALRPPALKIMEHGVSVTLQTKSALPYCDTFKKQSCNIIKSLNDIVLPLYWRLSVNVNRR